MERGEGGIAVSAVGIVISEIVIRAFRTVSERNGNLLS